MALASADAERPNGTGTFYSAPLRQEPAANPQLQFATVEEHLPPPTSDEPPPQR